MSTTVNIPTGAIQIIGAVASVPFNADGTAAGVKGAQGSANFTRPNDTTPYTSGDLVANSVTAGSVTPMQVTLGTANGQTINLSGARLIKSNTSRTNASFRAHFYTALPTPANGDNGAFSTDQAATYIGHIDLDLQAAGTGVAFTDGVQGYGYVAPAYVMGLGASSVVVFALLEARAAYTPAAQEVFTLQLQTS